MRSFTVDGEWRWCGGDSTSGEEIVGATFPRPGDYQILKYRVGGGRDRFEVTEPRIPVREFDAFYIVRRGEKLSA